MRNECEAGKVEKISSGVSAGSLEDHLSYVSEYNIKIPSKHVSENMPKVFTSPTFSALLFF
jgi:hypothetical protein